MKIAVTSTEPNLDGEIEPRFGRCRYVLVVDLDSLQFDSLENPNGSLGGGAGIESALLMADKGVAAVITGNCGPNAFQALEAAGIAVITGVSGCSVRDAAEQVRRVLRTDRGMRWKPQWIERD